MARGDARAAIRFQAGETHEFTLRRRRARTRNGETASGEGWSRLRVEVAGITPRGARLECTYVDAGATEVESAVVEAIRKLTVGLRFRYRAGRRGRFQGLSDLRGARRQLGPHLDLLVRSLPEAVRPALQSMLTGRAFAMHCLRDVPLLHAACGLACPPGGERLREVTVPNPFGAEPLPAVERVRHQAGEGGPVFSVERLFDPDLLRRTFTDHLSRMAATLGRPGPSAEDLTQVLLVDQGTFELEERGGWPLAIRFERETHLSSARETGVQTETIEIARASRVSP